MTLAADVLAKAGHFDEAQHIGRRATELFPADSSAWFAYGWSAKFASDWPVAEEALRRAVEIDPSVPMWHNNLGVVLLDLGRSKEALATFDRAIELDGSLDFAHNNRAVALQRLGRTKDAQQLFRAQVTKGVDAARDELAAAPDDLMLREQLTRALLRAERDRDALVHARALLEEEPTAARYDLVATALDWLDDLDGAVAACDAGLSVEPDDMDLLLERVWLATVLGDPDAARASTERIERAGAPTHALSARAHTAIAAEEWEEAVSLFDELLRLRPLSCCAIAWRGLAQLHLGCEEEAHAAVAEAERMSPARCGSARHLQRQLGSLVPA
jgi:tetratricopeptide (TPR) repeat protein